MKKIMQALYRGENLSSGACDELFKAMLGGDMSDIEIAGVLIALKVKGESGEEVASLVKLLRERAEPISRPDGLYADCCGTGGDGLGTFNVSTAAALTASACGLPMVKHGNRAASSPSGSADIIELCGIDLAMPANALSRLLNELGFCFLFAPAFHPLVGKVMPVRRGLATSTIFNLAGPLANPTSPPVQLMGVCEESLLQPMADVLQRIGCEKGLVVYGAGLDEVAIHDATQAILVTPDEQQPMTIDVSDFGVPNHELSSIQLKGQDPKAVFESVIEGRADDAKLDMVAINTGALLWLAGEAPSLKAGAETARTALEEGRVANHLQSLVTRSQQLMAS